MTFLMTDQRETIRVRDVMKHHVDMVDGRTSVADALRQMKHVETKTLIVRKVHDDDEYGMVLMSDIAREVVAKNRSPERVNVYEIMSKPVIAIDPEMDIRYCARLFYKFGLGRAPVIDEREIVGIVSYTDIVTRGLCREI